MAKLKMLRYPKKPEQSASVRSMENYIAKCKEIDKKNAQRKKENAKADALRKKINALKQKN